MRKPSLRHRVATRYPVYVALHTDLCKADKLESFVLPLQKNPGIAVKLLERFKESGFSTTPATMILGSS